ncbi:hypothetical protein ACIA8O_08050 [Kitasatospora sp. NPDC051853]|uniref:hypothetical protein n=1 Tax=Kitasatospora sp. NPDC051853 TaxID=3364058 RepID=UPI0037AFFF45
MTTLLDGLDDLPWAGMRVPGPGHDAGNIPVALRAMEAGEEGTTDIWGAAADAAHECYDVASNRYFEAAEHLVPFLTALCASPTVEAAVEAAGVLYDLAFAEPDDSEAAAGNTGMLERVRGLLLTGRPGYYAMLDRPEPAVRRAGWELLYAIDCGAPHHAAALERAWLTETDEETRRMVEHHRESLVVDEDEPMFGAHVPL